MILQKDMKFTKAVISPNRIGLALDEKIIGIVVVAPLAASAAGPPPANIAATLWFTNAKRTLSGVRIGVCRSAGLLDKLSY
jgi:hypothetical protein